MTEWKGIKERQKNNSTDRMLLKAVFSPAGSLKENISKELLSKNILN